MRRDKPKRSITVILTDHFIERYRERVGNASPSAQKAWVARSIATGRPKVQADGKYEVKLIGSPHVAIVSREYRNTWVAVTITGS